jgi:hypothetical protein
MSSCGCIGIDDLLGKCIFLTALASFWGTLQEMLCAPFLQAGFVCRDVHIHTRTVVNRKSGVKMRRRFVQAVLCLPPGPPATILRSHPSCQPCTEISSANHEDHAQSSKKEQPCTELLQCLRVAAALSDWTEQRNSKPSTSESELSQWLHDMPHLLRDRYFIRTQLAGRSLILVRDNVVAPNSGSQCTLQRKATVSG